MKQTRLEISEISPWKKEERRTPQELSGDFQTPPEVCQYMASLIPSGVKTVLEPTPGLGNLLSCLNGYDVTAPEDYFLLPKKSYDCAILNPPFSSRSAILDNAPADLQDSGMRVGYYFLTECMKVSDNVIALMPWFTISDSDLRLRTIKDFGLISITALPRKTFSYARIQTMVLQMQKGYIGPIEFKVFEFIKKETYTHPQLFDLETT